MKRVSLTTVAVLTCLCGFAETKIWTGGGAWSDAASWDPAGEPAATDTVRFTASADVTPTTSFAGLVSVESGTLTLTATSDLSLTLAVKTGARFEKVGTGTLKAKACPALEAGFLTGGAIAVAEGTMRFAGRGQLDAPGFFGVLEVAAGATAEVVESPAVGRHGGLVRVLKLGEDRQNTEDAIYLATVASLENIRAKWVASLTDETLADYAQFTGTETDGVRPFYGLDCLPPALATWPKTPDGCDWSTLMARGLFVGNGGDVVISGKSYWRYTPFFDLQAGTATAGSTRNPQVFSGSKQLAFGWHAYDMCSLRYQKTDAPDVRIVYPGAKIHEESYCGDDSLWFGVCFDGISLAEGATLNVAADQAVAFAGRAATTLSGTVTGGAGSYFALMAGDWTIADWTAFSGFAGTFELGNLARLRPGAVTVSALPFGCDWRGTVVAADGLTGLSAASFTGTLEVPEGLAFAADQASLGGMKTVFGAGELSFAGEVDADFLAKLDVGVRVAEVKTPRNALGKADVDLPVGGWASGEWTYAARNIDYAAPHPSCSVNAAGDTLTLIQAPGDKSKGQVEYAAAWNNRQLAATDALGLSFRMYCYNPRYSEYDVAPAGYESMANGLGFFLQNSGLGYYWQNQEGGPESGCGFVINYYQGTFFRWVTASGTVREYNLEQAENGGFERGVPYDVSLGVTNGILSVTFVQEKTNGQTAVFSSSYDVGTVFSDGQKAWYGFTAGTAYGYSYFREDLSSLAGTVRTTTVAACDLVDAGQSVSAENWDFKQYTSLTNDNEIYLQQPEPPGMNYHNSYCYGKNPVSMLVPFEMSFDVIFDSQTSTTWANGWGCGFVDEKPTNMDGNTFTPNAHNAIQFYHHTYTRTFGVAQRTAGATVTLQQSAANPGGIENKLGESGKLHIVLAYDGMGTLAVTITQPGFGKSYSFSQYFSNYADMTDGKAYLAFTAYSGWNLCEETRIQNLVYQTPSDNGARVLRSPVTLAAQCAIDVGQSVSAENWDFKQYTSLTNDNEIYLQQREPPGMTYHQSFCYGQNSVSMLESFELSFDVIFDSQTKDRWANGWGCGFVDEKPTSMHDASFTPNAHNAMYFYQHTWLSVFGMAQRASGTTESLQQSAANPGGIVNTLGAVGQLHVVLAYDGKGTLAATITQPGRGKSYSFSQSFSNYTDMTDGKAYLAFTAYSGVNNCEETRIRNLIFKTAVGGESRIPMTYFSTETMVQDPGSGLTYADLSLTADTVLALSTSGASSSGWFGFGNLTVAAGASLAASAGVTAQLDRITLTGESPNALTVTGAWDAKDGRLTVVVPVAWRQAGPFVVLQADPAQYVGAGDDPVFTVVDAAGRRLRGTVERTAEGYRFTRSGFTLIIR